MVKKRSVINLKKIKPFLGYYQELQITYDFDTLTVEMDGRDRDGFWENLLIQTEVNNPQDYAFGMFDLIAKLYPNQHITVAPAKHVSEEGYLIDDPSN